MIYIEQNPKHKFKPGYYMVEYNYRNFGQKRIKIDIYRNFCK